MSDGKVAIDKKAYRIKGVQPEQLEEKLNKRS
jgi:hypothetical protein